MTIDSLTTSLHRLGLRGLVLCCTASVLTLSGCTSTRVDPRVSIEAPNEEYRGRLAQSINGSELWTAYLEHVAPGGGGGSVPLVSVILGMERKVTRRTGDGDYDPGIVKIEFSVHSLLHRSQVYSEKKEKKLDDFIFGRFDTSSREAIQRAAFEAAEDDVFPYLDRWLNLAIIRIMAKEGRNGAAFIPLLEAQVEDPWAEDLSNEATQALKAIRGG